jgi:hypothetical protein
LPGISQEFVGQFAIEFARKFGDEIAGKFARRICWEFEVNLPPGILPGETCHRQFAGGIC